MLAHVKKSYNRNRVFKKKLGFSSPIYPRLHPDKSGQAESKQAGFSTCLALSFYMSRYVLCAAISDAENKYIIALKSCQHQIDLLRFEHHLAGFAVGKLAERRLCFDKWKVIGNHPSKR